MISLNSRPHPNPPPRGDLKFNQDEQYRILDEAHRRFLHDFATDVEEAHNQGIDEGKIEEKIEIARNMKLKGYPADAIVDLTGLTREKIEQLG